MPQDSRDSSAAQSAGAGFRTTHWSVVLAAGDDGSPRGMVALEELCRAYWYPLYAFVRRKGHDAEDARDLTQQFFVRLIEGNRVSLADPQRGRFRTFLLGSLQNFLLNEWAKSARQKRGGQFEFVPLLSDDPENLYAAEPADHRTPEMLFEQRWAAAVMDRAFTRLAAGQSAGRARLFEALQPFIWGDKSGTPHAETATALGLSEGAVRVAVHRLRGRFRELLREEIAQTVATPEEVNDELRHLIEIVSRAPM
ncbi:MAG: sigma-70 family RNA polymerase sigma factor [Pedosphaera sp.]|nr:sigma-70 family RNA polymerase sigma factor [Pedosphaera sp.]